MKRHELLWMLIPCLLFVGVALWMRAREAKSPPNDGNFRLVIEKVEKRPVKANDVADGYDTQVVATLNHTGPEPPWWGKQSGYDGSSGPAHLFYGDSWRKYPTPVFYWRPGWNSKLKRYEARFLMNLSRMPRDSQNTTLRANICVEDNAVFPRKPLCQVTPLKFVVRKAKETIKAPLVSQNPLLRIIKAEVNKYTVAQQKVNGGLDTVVRVFLQDLKPSDPGGLSHGGEYLVDEKGRDVDTPGGLSSSSGVWSVDAHRPILRYECRLSSVPRSQRNVFVRMKYSQSNRWPMVIKVPLRLKGKDIKGKVQAVPVN